MQNAYQAVPGGPESWVEIIPLSEDFKSHKSKSNVTWGDGMRVCQHHHLYPVMMDVRFALQSQKRREGKREQPGEKKSRELR